jgi:hypothetical protein
MLQKTFCYSPEAIIDFSIQITRECSAIHYMCTTLVGEIKVTSIPDKFLMQIIILKIYQALST